MLIGEVAAQVGMTPHAIRLYERDGLVPEPPRGLNGYREYDERDVQHLRLLVGLRRLDLPLAEAAELAGMCAAGRCNDVSAELRGMLTEKRSEIRRRIVDLHYLERRMAHLEGSLAAGESPRTLITLGKEEREHETA